MRVSILGVGVLFLVSGCDADRISSAEAERVFQSQAGMVGELYRTVLDAVQGVEVPGGLSVDVDETGGTVSGQLEGADGWSGSASLEGAAEIDTGANDYAFDLALSYAGVSVDGVGVVMDGEVGASSAAHLDTAGGVLDYSFETDGDLSVSGEAAGQASFDFSLTVGVDLSTGSFNLDVSGDVSGHDASELSLSNATTWVAALYN